MKVIVLNKPSLGDYREVFRLHNEVFSKFPAFKKYSALVAQERMTKESDPAIIKVLDGKNRLIAYAICYER